MERHAVEWVQGELLDDPEPGARGRVSPGMFRGLSRETWAFPNRQRDPWRAWGAGSGVIRSVGEEE